MNRKMFLIAQVVLLTLLGGVVVVSARSSNADAGNKYNTAPVAVQGSANSPGRPLVPTTSGFTYQGRLLDGSTPANGSFDFTFTLYDAASGGNLIAGPLAMPGVSVSDGLFTVVLDFNPGDYNASSFQGEARWLQIGVSGTTLSPRQPVTAAPYGMGLMPGAAVINTANNVDLFLVNNTGNGVGVRGVSDSGKGIVGNTTTGTAVEGNASGFGHGVSGTGTKCAVCGYSTGGGPSIHGEPINGASGLAGQFIGDVTVSGALNASVKNFKIDDPLDPANKYLYHTSVESPDMMNIYNGNATTDSKGEATVTLPDYFETLNRDFRYQLTIVGDQFAQVRVSSKIKNNKFSIETDKPNIEVSWQVTGIRQDPYANQHRSPVEENKPSNEKGYYLHPELYGQASDKQIGHIDPPAASQGRK